MKNYFRGSCVKQKLGKTDKETRPVVHKHQETEFYTLAPTIFRFSAWYWCFEVAPRIMENLYTSGLS